MSLLFSSKPVGYSRALNASRKGELISTKQMEWGAACTVVGVILLQELIVIECSSFKTYKTFPNFIKLSEYAITTTWTTNNWITTGAVLDAVRVIHKASLIAISKITSISTRQYLPHDACRALTYPMSDKNRSVQVITKQVKLYLIDIALRLVLWDGSFCVLMWRTCSNSLSMRLYLMDVIYFIG